MGGTLFSDEAERNENTHYKIIDKRWAVVLRRTRGPGGFKTHSCNNYGIPADNGNIYRRIATGTFPTSRTNVEIAEFGTPNSPNNCMMQKLDDPDILVFTRAEFIRPVNVIRCPYCGVWFSAENL